MKFDITKKVNCDLLLEELQAEFGNRVSLTADSTVSITGTEDDFSRAEEIVAAHDPNNFTLKQGRQLEYESEVRGVRNSLGLTFGEIEFDEFVDMLANNSDKVSELLWLLWLEANRPDK